MIGPDIESKARGRVTAGFSLASQRNVAFEFRSQRKIRICNRSKGTDHFALHLSSD